MCSQGLQATPRILIVEFKGKVCDFGPLAGPNRIAKIISAIGSHAPNSASDFASSHYTGSKF